MRFGDSLQEGLADAVLDVPVVARRSYEELQVNAKVFIISPEVTSIVREASWEQGETQLRPTWFSM